MNLDPHKEQDALYAGAPIGMARAGIILLHGRAGTAKGMLRLAPQLMVEDVCFVAPQAEGNSWYPESFTSELMNNEPWVSSSLLCIKRMLMQFGEAGISPEKVMLFGFSQGACLALEYLARNPRRYGGLAAHKRQLDGERGAIVWLIYCATGNACSSGIWRAG